MTDTRGTFADLVGLARRELEETTAPLLALRDVVGHLGDLEGDELELIRLAAYRLRLGRHAYGQLDVDAPGRDWRAEAVEEAADLAIYLLADLLRRQRAGAAYVIHRDGRVGAATPPPAYVTGSELRWSAGHHVAPMPALQDWTRVNAFAVDVGAVDVWLHSPCGRVWVRRPEAELLTCFCDGGMREVGS